MKRPTLSERLHYAFDNSLSRGPAVLVLYLALASAAVVLALSLIVWATGIAPEADGQAPGFLSIAWMSLMRTLDAGTMGGDNGSRLFLASMLLVTLGGIFVVSTFIGVLTSGIDDRLSQMRKGRSRVLESGHTVILGWTPEVFTIISELVIANANQRNASIVILADQDKVEMDDQIRERVGATGNTKVVTRTGRPTEMADLSIANVQASRSIIVLAPRGDDDPDTVVIKTILAIVNDRARRAEPYHVVAQLKDQRNADVAVLAGRDEVEIVASEDVLARITVQTCRQSGLSSAYLELLDFEGAELYFKVEPALVGKTFAEAITAYETSSIIGLRPAAGGVTLNPPFDTVIQAGDAVIAISDDDNTVVMGAQPAPVDHAAIVPRSSGPAAPERTLIIGWNARGPIMLRELDGYVAPGSYVSVVGTEAMTAAALASTRHCQNLTIGAQAGDTRSREFLDALDIPSYHHVILLGDESLTSERSDAQTLMTLLHLRDIAEKTGHRFSITSEIRDVRDRELAEVTRADDFIVGERLISLLLTQVSEDKALNAVFQELFRSDGSDIYLKLAADYVLTDTDVSFATLVEAARQRGEIAIGYRHKALANDASQAYGVRLNPPKSSRVRLAARDRVIVLAEN